MEKEWVVVSGGPILHSNHTRQALSHATTIIGVDSGALHVRNAGYYPTLVIGDRDSLQQKDIEDLKAHNVRFEDIQTTLLSVPDGQVGSIHPSQKDQTDMQMALEYAIAHGAYNITVIGGTSDERFAHALGNMALAVQFAQLHPEVLIRFITGTQVIWARKGPRRETIIGKKGEILNLVPQQLSGVTHVMTEGLFYPLHNETLAYGVRGLSNKLTHDHAVVAFEDGIMVFIHEQEE